MAQKELTRKELAEIVRKDIKKYDIRLVDIEKGTTLNYFTAQKMMSDDDHVPHLNTLLKIKDFIDREYNYPQGDKSNKNIIEVAGKPILEKDFMRAFFDNKSRFRKYEEFNLYETALKRLGVIEYIEEKNNGKDDTMRLVQG